MCTCRLKQVVTCIHLLTKRVEGANHLGNIGDDGVGLFIGNLCQEVVGYRLVEAEFNLLRVNKYYLKFGRMFLI